MTDLVSTCFSILRQNLFACLSDDDKVILSMTNHFFRAVLIEYYKPLKQRSVGRLLVQRYADIKQVIRCIKYKKVKDERLYLILTLTEVGKFDLFKRIFMNRIGHEATFWHTCAANGRVDFMKHAYELLKPRNMGWNWMTCYQAAIHGQLECLKFFLEIHLKSDRYDLCDWGGMTCAYAAENGHLNCLKYAHESYVSSRAGAKGCAWNWMTCAYAAGRGQLECLRYAHDPASWGGAKGDVGCEWDEMTCANAALNGQLECLRYAHENGCPWNKQTCFNAVKEGHLNCLKFAWENGSGWNRSRNKLIAIALQEGHIECAAYLEDTKRSRIGRLALTRP